jgi:hypothetical protein
MALTIKTTNATIDDVFTTYKAAVRMTMVEGDITARHVDRTTLPNHEGLTWNEAKITQPDAGAWQEGEPHPETTMTSTVLQITPAQSGLKVLVTSRHLNMAPAELGGKIAKVIGVALDNYKDDQLVLDFDSGAISIPGAGSAFSAGVARAARARIRHGNAGEPYHGNDFHGVLQPYTMHDLMESMGGYSSGNPTNTDPGLTQDILKKYAVYEWFGIQFEEDSNITTDASDDAKSAIFAREALRLVDFAAPKTDKEYIKDTGVHVFYGDQDFGHGVYYTNWLAEIYADVLAPTS